MRAQDMSLPDQVRMLSGGTVWMTQGLPGVRSVMLSDGPHGLRTQPGSGDQLGLSQSLPATCFPTAAALASTWDPDLAEQVGAAIGAQARALGVAVVLGPGMNIKRHPLCGRNFEYFSEDPLLTGRLAAAMVRGIQSQGVGACLKHFAVNNQENHRFVVDAVVDERSLRELYLPAFEYAVKTASPWAVMSAYNLVNGQNCSDNRRLLTEILRDEWGFDGMVVSDWGGTNDRVAAVRAGMDLEMPGGASAFDGEVLQAVADGELAEEDVRICAQRVLDLVERVGQDPGPPVPFDDHDRLARTVAACGTVLLTNDGVLPASPDVSLAVIGEFAKAPRFQGSGSSSVNAERVTSAMDALHDRGVRVAYAPGYHADGSPAPATFIEDAVATARSADVVLLMVGLPPIIESEGFDREHMHLPPEQERLIDAVCQANPRTVVSVSAGAPVVMPWVHRPAAILMSYLGGQASGSALCDVLFGDTEPKGRLAETFPVQQTDLASDPYFPGQPHQVQYREGLAVGYRHMTTAGIAPLFCFGHGLGYTTFEVDESRAPSQVDPGEPLAVSVALRNTGDRDGSTVIQVYVNAAGTAAAPRPRRELAGFAKVTLPAGASGTVDIAVDERALAYFDAGTGQWRTPAGTYELEVGFSSEDIVTSVTVTVAGDPEEMGEAEPLVAASDVQFARRLGRPVPAARPVRPFSRMSTVGEISTTRLGRVVRSVVLRNSGYHAEDDPTTAKMLLRSVDELPLRSVALFGEGRVSLSMIDGLVDLLNGEAVSAAMATGRGVFVRVGRLLRR